MSFYNVLLKAFYNAFVLFVSYHGGPNWAERQGTHLVNKYIINNYVCIPF